MILPPLMPYRFDLHMHSFFSKDAIDPPEALIVAAQERGLNGIAITDHDTCEAYEDLIQKGLARSDGQPVNGFLVVTGVEVTTAEGHLLCIGTTLPRMRLQPARVVMQIIQERGGIAIPAHPYDHWRAGIRRTVLDTLPLEALEVFNAAVTREKYNKLALAYATSRNLSRIASSDGHSASVVGLSTTVFAMETLSLPALLAAIRRGGIPEGQYLSRVKTLQKHFIRWIRVRKVRPQPRRSKT